MFLADFAYTQLTFVNNTPCPVRVTGVISTSPTPCTAGPYCTATWISVPPFSTGVLPAPPCLGTVGSSPTFVRVGVQTTTTFLGVSICGAPSTTYTDCTGAPRTLTQFSGSFAAIF